MTSSFVLSQRRPRSSHTSGTLKWQSKVLGQTYASTYSFCTQLLDVTRHITVTSIGSERELPSRKYKLATHFVNTLKYCSRIQLPSTMWHVHERKHWWYYTMETRLTAWTPFGISGSVRRSHQSRLMFIHECYHQTPGAAMYHSLREYLQVQE